MARVRVHEDTWREFRHAIGPYTVAERLGELVEREVAERRRRRLHAGRLDADEVQQALDQAGALGRDLAAITIRLEALARVPTTPTECGAGDSQGLATRRPPPPVGSRGGERRASNDPSDWLA